MREDLPVTPAQEAADPLAPENVRCDFLTAPTPGPATGFVYATTYAALYAREQETQARVADLEARIEKLVAHYEQVQSSEGALAASVLRSLLAEEGENGE